MSTPDKSTLIKLKSILNLEAPLGASIPIDWEPINIDPKILTPKDIKLYTWLSIRSFSSIRFMKNYPRISALKFRSIIRKAKQARTI